MVEYYTLWAHQIKTPIAAMGLLLQDDDTDRGRELSAELFKSSSTWKWCSSICALAATARII